MAFEIEPDWLTELRRENHRLILDRLDLRRKVEKLQARVEELEEEIQHDRMYRRDSSLD